MAECSAELEVQQLRLGAGARFRGEDILAITKGAAGKRGRLRRRVSGRAEFHLMDVLADPPDILGELGVHFESSANDPAATATLARSVIDLILRRAVQSVVQRRDRGRPDHSGGGLRRGLLDHGGAQPCLRDEVAVVATDCSADSAADAGFVLTIPFVEAWEATHIPSRSWLPLRADWHKRPPRTYVKLLDDGPHSGPAPTVIKWLEEEGDVHGFCTETIGTDAGQAAHFNLPYPVALCAGSRPLRTAIPSQPRPVAADRRGDSSGPGKIRQGSDSPLRVLALAKTRHERHGGSFPPTQSLLRRSRSLNGYRDPDCQRSLPTCWPTNKAPVVSLQMAPGGAMRAGSGPQQWLRRRIGGNRDGTRRLLDRRRFVRIGDHWRIAGRNRRIRQRIYVYIYVQRYYDRNGRTASCAVRPARSSRRLVDSNAWLIASR
jgi:hypothetical protein